MTVVMAWLALPLSLSSSDPVVKRVPIDLDLAARRAHYAVERPVLRGFRAEILQMSGEGWPIAMPDPKGDAGLVAAAELVAKRLARDGLGATTARAVELIGPARFIGEDHPDLLRAVGLPTDWLAYFGAPKQVSLARFVAEELVNGASIAEILPELAQYPFTFKPTISGFRVATESGENPIDVVRMQIASADYYAGQGDGGSVDVFRQLLVQLPDARFVAGIENKNLDRCLERVRGWNVVDPSRITLLPQSLPLAQWAQDNGKSGVVEEGGARSIATLVPRYASRGEDGAVFVPGDTFALEGFASTGQRIAQSPLLFQGGNLLPVRDPKSGKRSMVVGEADVWRNVALGLTVEQVLEAFRREFGVDSCILLPAISFHVDYEVSMHAMQDELVAFMSDTAAATRLALGCALGALEKNGSLNADDARLAREDLAADKVDALMQRINDVIAPKLAGLGAFPETYSKTFAASSVDSGVGNVHRFMIAFDAMTAERLGGSKIEDLGLEPHMQAYIASFRTREAERRDVAMALIKQGIRVVGVPSTSEGGRSLNTLNGVHAPGVYLMPAYGGLFADFDAAAKKAFEAALPGVTVTPILCGESERREGALHCSVSIVPRIP